MGSAKAIYTTLGVIAILISLTASVTGGLMVLDASGIHPVLPEAGNIKFSYDPTPPGLLNVSFPLTIVYDGSYYTIKDINLTLAIYPSSDGIGNPLILNTTLLSLNPHSTITIDYHFIKTSLPVLTHLSFRAIVSGNMALGGVSLIGFSLNMLYTIF